MVILGGLELVAAGYLIHKHQQNKKDKQRLEDEATALEESQYRIFPPDGPSHHRRRRPHSRERRHSPGRHSHERHDRKNRYDRPHSADAKYRREERSPRRESGRPPTPQMNGPLPPQMQMSPPIPTQMPPGAMRPPQPQPQAQPQGFAPPPYANVPNTSPLPPQDMKYGWTDEPAPPRPQQDPNDPPTGWPAHWGQTQSPAVSGYGAHRATPQHHGGGESSRSRGRHERRTPEPTPRVRFAVPATERSLSRSPPPSYRA